MPFLLSVTRACAAAALAAAWASPTLAGGGHGGGFRRVGAWGAPLSRPFAPARGWGARALPPISGVIHERPGMRPYISAYGHTATSLRYGAPAGAYGRPGGYGHVGTAPRPQVYAAGRPVYGRPGAGRRVFARRGFVGGLGGGIGYGGVGYGGAGLYGAPGTYGAPGVYAGAGTYGAPGTYGTTATQSLYGSGGGAYLSERPVAARYAEGPLAPSPFAPYDPEDRYGGDGGPSGPRILRVHRAAAPGACACGPRVLPYGVGTAY